MGLQMLLCVGTCLEDLFLVGQMVLANELTTSDCIGLAGREAVSIYLHDISCHHMFCLLVPSLPDRVHEALDSPGQEKALCASQKKQTLGTMTAVTA